MEIKSEKQDKNYRIWEIDFLRGFLILGVLYCHFYVNIQTYNNNTFFSAELNKIYDILTFLPDNYIPNAISAFVAMFFVVSGLSANLSKNNKKRTIILLIAAYSLTLITVLQTLIFKQNVITIFGVLHAYTVCSLCYLAVKKFPLWSIIVICCALFLLKYLLQQPYVFDHFNIGVFYYVGLPTRFYPNFNGGEHIVITDFLPYYFVGLILARTLYKQKSSLLPKLESILTKPLQYLGKYSGQIYLAQAVFLPLVTYLFCMFVASINWGVFG